MKQQRSEWADSTQTRAFETLVELLWTEREALEILLCKVVVGQLVGYAADKDTADREVSAVLERLRLTEVLRAAEVEELARGARLPLEVTLGRLAEVAPQPWATVLIDHEVALRRLLTDLEGFAELQQQSLREFLG